MDTVAVLIPPTWDMIITGPIGQVNDIFCVRTAHKNRTSNYQYPSRNHTGYQTSSHHSSLITTLNRSTMPKFEDINPLLLILSLPIFLVDYLLSLVLTLISQQPNTKNDPEMQSVAVGEATLYHGAPRRSPISPNEFIATYKGATTIYDMMQNSVSKFGDDRVAMQHFEFLGLAKAKETDRFPSKQFDYDKGMIQITYKEFGENLAAFGKGLRELGLEPQPACANEHEFENAKGKFCLVIFEDTCKEWTTAFQGAMSQNMVVATCYATLGVDAVVAAVNETQASALLVNWKQAQDFYKRADSMPSLTTIIASTHELSKGDQIWIPPKDGASKVRVVGYAQVMELGNSSKREPTPPKVSRVRHTRLFCVNRIQLG
jgi:AMP-binding enzyme